MSDPFLLSAQIITILSVLFAAWDNRRLSAYQKRLEVSLEHKRQQLADFYAPMNLLLTRTSVLRDMLQEAMERGDDSGAQEVLESHLLKLNTEVVALIMKSAHLVDVRDSGELFAMFLKHNEALVMRFGGSQSRLDFPHLPFPHRLVAHVKETHEALRREYMLMLGDRQLWQADPWRRTP